MGRQTLCYIGTRAGSPVLEIRIDGELVGAEGPAISKSWSLAHHLHDVCRSPCGIPSGETQLELTDLAFHSASIPTGLVSPHEIG